MAFTGIMTTEAVIDQKTGAGVNTAFTDTMKTAAVLHAESTVNGVARFNFSDVYAATLNVDYKHLLDEIVSSMVAMQGIAYDMSGYTTIREAENMINIHDKIVDRGLSIIRKQKHKDFINGT